VWDRGYSSQGILGCDAVQCCDRIPTFEVCRWRQHGPLKHWYLTTRLHYIITQKTSTWNLTAMKAAKLATKVVQFHLFFLVYVLMMIIKWQKIITQDFIWLLFIGTHFYFWWHYIYFYRRASLKNINKYYMKLPL